MTLTKGDIALSVVCVVAGILLGAGFRSCSPNKQPAPEPIVIHDTLTVTDTLRIKGKTKTLEVHDTVWVVRDTFASDINVGSKPQMLVNETKLYRDTFTTDSSFIALGVKYSGYDANIDNVDLQYQFQVQPRTIVKKKGWGWSVHIGPYVGYGVTVIDNRVYAAPSAGLSVSMGFGYHWK